MSSALGSVVKEVKEKQQPFHVDREKTCPLLLRVFCSQDHHHSLTDYQNGILPLNELQIYTWMDATLRELTNLIREVNSESNVKGTTFEFQLVAPDKLFPRFNGRDVGVARSGIKGPDDDKTLKMLNFVIGDYMDVVIIPPENNRMSRRRNISNRYKR